MSPQVQASVEFETETTLATVSNYIAGVAKDDTGTLLSKEETAIDLGVDRSPDSDLARTARSAIERNPFVKPGTVRPIVRNGWLILVGEVERPIQKVMAEEAVRSLAGLRGMSNNILIKSDALARRVSQKIDEAFVRSALISAHRVSITASDQKIILSGCVRSIAEYEEAETGAWSVPGVAQVVNRLRVGG